MGDIVMLYSTFKNRDEAVLVAGQLLEKRLVACANVIDHVTSLYRWEGAVCQEPEAILLAKTTAQKQDAAIALVKRLHSYQLPCIIAYPAAGGFPPFLEWVASETH